VIFNFDPPEMGWTLSSTATIVADPTAPTQPNCLSMIVGATPASDCRRILSGLVPGSLYHALAYMNFDGTVDPFPSIAFSYNDAEGGSPGLYSVQRRDPLSSGGWEIRDLGFLDYTVPDATLFLRGLTAFGQTGTVLVDQLLLLGSTAVARSRWLAHQRLVAVLKGINGGATFYTDLGNRVFTKYMRPVGSTSPALPYLCVPLVNSAPRVEHDNTRIKITWTLPIMAFVSEPNVGAFDSDAIAKLYHLGEDVFKAVMQDPTLNGTVAPVSFVSGGIEEAGISPFDGMPYADAVIPIDLSMFLGLDVLGP